MPWPTSLRTVRAWRWACLLPLGYRTPVSSSSCSLLEYISSFRCSCAIVCVDFWLRFSNAALTRCACWRSTLESSIADSRRYSLTFSAENDTRKSQYHNYVHNMGLLSFISPDRQHLRSASTGLLQVPRARAMIGWRGFAVAGPSLWNSHLAALRRLDMTLHTFKWQPKAYQFHI